MIITRTPYRVSFFGGGTDYPAWYQQHGGQVLTSSLDKYTYISLRRVPAFLGSKYRVFWGKVENVDRREEIEHNGVRGCLEYLEIDDGIEVNHAGDLPARSGLGSSSAFTVGMLNALHAMKGEHRSHRQLAQEAIDVEQNVLKETVGVQDQIECAHGGFNHIKITQMGYSIYPINVPTDKLEGNLLLYFTGLQRYASEIAEAQVKALKEEELHRIAELVDEAIECLAENKLRNFGHKLHESWMLKRRLSDKVSNPEINDIYGRARNAGAIGGKLLGAGGGGFMLLYVESQEQSSVRAALSEFIEVPFRFGHEGSRVMVNEP